MFELPDDLINWSKPFSVRSTYGGSNRVLTVIAKTELIVDKVSANIPSKQLTKLNNVHIILRNKCLMSALSGFKTTETLVK